MPDLIIVTIPPDYMLCVKIITITLVLWALFSVLHTVWESWQHAQWDRPIKAVDESYKYQTKPTPHIGDFLSSAETQKHETPKSMIRLKQESLQAQAMLQWRLEQVRKQQARQAKGNGA